MSRLFLPLLLLVFLLPSTSFAETVNWNKLVQREGVFYKKFNDIPFTGMVKGMHQGSLKEGKWDGPYKEFYRQAGELNVVSKGTYKDGEKEGIWVDFWSNGQLFEKGTYKNGKKEGRFVFFDQSGRKDPRSGTYRNGKKVSD